jgi:DNA recombination protein RmuC
MLYAARSSRKKISLEEKLIASSSQFNQLKANVEKIAFEKQLETSNTEKKISEVKRQSCNSTLKKKVDFENLWRQKQKKRRSRKTSRKIHEKFEINQIKY